MLQVRRQLGIERDVGGDGASRLGCIDPIAARDIGKTGTPHAVVKFSGRVDRDRTGSLDDAAIVGGVAVAWRTRARDDVNMPVDEAVYLSRDITGVVGGTSDPVTLVECKKGDRFIYSGQAQPRK